MRDYPIVIDETTLKRETQKHNITLGDSQDTLISLLPGTKLPTGSTVDIVKPSVDDDYMKIRIAGGEIEQSLKKLAESRKAQGLISVALSDQLFSGLASRGFLLGHYSEDESKNKSDTYLRSILSGNNPPLIAHMIVGTAPSYA